MPYLLFALICVIWGSSFILMKKAALCFTPTAIGAWRVIGGAAILGLVVWWRGRHGSCRKSDVLPFLIVVLTGFAWPFSLQPHLVALHGSAFIGMTVSFTPLLTIAASVPMLGVYPTRRQLCGVLGALGCMGVLFADGLDRNIPPWDLLAAVSVPLSYAVTNTVIRRHLSHLASLELTFVSLAAAGCLLLPLSYVVPSSLPTDAERLTTAVLSLAFLGVVGTGIATWWFNTLIQAHGPLFAGMVTNLVPVGAVLWGWSDAEQVTELQLAALAGIVMMVSLVQYGAARPAGVPPSAAR